MSRDVNDESLKRFLAGPVHAVHLDFESQLVPYVEGTADAADSEVIESHLDDCARCRQDVADLRTVRRAMERPAPARRRRLPVAIAASVVLIAGALLWYRRPSQPVPAPPPPPQSTATVAPQAPGYADPAWAGLVSTAIATKSLPFPAALAEIALRGDTLRAPAQKTSSALDPSGRFIRDAQPQFRWRGREGATYVVLIFAGDEEVTRSPSLDAPRWTPARPLERGRTYTWQVIVRRGGEEEDILPLAEEPPARFAITSAADEENIESALRVHPDDALLHAVLLAKAGLEAEAQTALRDAASRGNADARAILER